MYPSIYCYQLPNNGLKIVIYDDNSYVSGITVLGSVHEIQEIIDKFRTNFPEKFHDYIIQRLLNVTGTSVPSLVYSKIKGLNEIVNHPVENIDKTFSQTIMSLNDIYRWTREEIADWLDTLDKQPTFGE